ncbi:acyltransferase family protein [Verrucomicrobiota bacterium sgz303538]
MKQLDTIRLIAVAMVIATHWGDGNMPFWFNGNLGVQLFFVISGFLITGILLSARTTAEQSGYRLSGVIKSFYARRFLRLFPLFYVTLAVTFLLGFPAVRSSLLWHVSYLSNVYLAIRGGWFGEVSHFWSLAVEEQFYLVWPFLILFSPRRVLPALITSVIAVAPIFRFVCSDVLELNPVAAYVLPFSSTDSLGLGALLAFLRERNCGKGNKARTLLKWASIAGAGVVIVTHLGSASNSFLCGFHSIEGVALPFALVGVVWITGNGIGGPLRTVMEFTPLVYLGRISYGLYVLHNFVPRATNKVFVALGVSSLGAPAYLKHLLDIAVLIILSSLSWHVLEKRINNLKRLFPYTPPYSPGKQAIRSESCVLENV